ncbi:hypothetical protein VTK26DRAFT_3206 [Humicola hyalothermophila]
MHPEGAIRASYSEEMSKSQRVNGGSYSEPGFDCIVTFTNSDFTSLPYLDYVLNTFPVGPSRISQISSTAIACRSSANEKVPIQQPSAAPVDIFQVAPETFN